MHISNLGADSEILIVFLDSMFEDASCRDIS